MNFGDLKPFLSDIIRRMKESNRHLCCIAANTSGGGGGGSCSYNNNARVYIPPDTAYDVLANFPTAHSVSLSVVLAGVYNVSNNNWATLKTGAGAPIQLPLGYSDTITACTTLVADMIFGNSDGAANAVILNINY